jgi:ATP-binding cassette subfamily C (CFTR/MRP) protein 1
MFNYSVGGLYVATYLLISIVVIAIWVVPWVAIIFPVMLICVIVLYKLAIDATKEVSRIESVSKSPLLAFLSETISGSSTIRAFSRQSEFIDHNNKILNRNILACQWSEAVPLWFMIRVDLLSIVTMAAISIFCITARFKGDSIMLSLLLTYILNLQIIVISVVRQMMEIEARMVNVERLLSLLKVP